MKTFVVDDARRCCCVHAAHTSSSRRGNVWRRSFDPAQRTSAFVAESIAGGHRQGHSRFSCSVQSFATHATYARVALPPCILWPAITYFHPSQPLPEDDTSTPRTLYAKGPFPNDVTLEALQTWAAQFGAVDRVVMRRLRNKEKTFKGSVFVEFSDEASVAAALAAAGKEGGVTFEGKPVEKLESYESYRARKNAERQSRIAEKAGTKAAKVAAALGDAEEEQAASSSRGGGDGPREFVCAV